MVISVFCPQRHYVDITAIAPRERTRWQQIDCLLETRAWIEVD